MAAVSIVKMLAAAFFLQFNQSAFHFIFYLVISKPTRMPS